MHDLYETHDDGRTAVVTLRGELDAHDAPRLRELFSAVVTELDGASGPRLVLDLTGVAFLDSTALGTIVGAVRRVREIGGELAIVLPETPARRIFEITGLDEVLDVHPSRAAALAPAAG
ncbi:MAG TPA: STAS domain-containing protein [Gaiella sp.]|jgi:anti-sigma B factor antagonist|nr:STAS domain-containing protein [Gaiella sp.]